MMSGIPKCVDKKNPQKMCLHQNIDYHVHFFIIDRLGHNKYWFQYLFGVHIEQENFQNQKHLEYTYQVNDLHGNCQFYEEIFFYNHVNKNNYLVSRNI